MALQRISEVIRFLHSPPHRGLMVRSAILWGLGDVAAQAMVHYSAQDKDEESISFGNKDKEFKINWYRVYKTSVFGAFACIGPAAYYRFRFNKRLWSSITTAEVVSSAAREGLWATINLATFFPFVGSTPRARSVEQAKEDMKRGFTPALVLGGAVVPTLLFTNWRFVPTPYQLHCASLFALVGSCSLSLIDLSTTRMMAQRFWKDGTSMA